MESFINVRPQKLLPRFRRSGVEGLLKAHESNRRSLYYRVKTYFWQALSGIRFFWFLRAFNDHARRLPKATMAGESWNFLQYIGFRLVVDWGFDKKSLEGFPVLFYSDHPSYLEPLLILAALKEFDPKVVATAWLKNLSPLIGERIIAVPESLELVRKSLTKYHGFRRLLETIWMHTIVIPVTRHLQGDVSPQEGRRGNLGAVRAIIKTLLKNEAVLLFPQGGEGQKPWVKDHIEDFTRLIEFLFRNLKKNPALSELRLVPVVIRHFSMRSLLKSRIVMNFHPFYLPFRFLPQKPFHVVVRETFTLAELAQAFSEGEDMVHFEDMVRYLMGRAKIGD